MIALEVTSFFITANLGPFLALPIVGREEELDPAKPYSEPETEQEFAKTKTGREKLEPKQIFITLGLSIKRKVSVREWAAQRIKGPRQTINKTIEKKIEKNKKGCKIKKIDNIILFLILLGMVMEA